MKELFREVSDYRHYCLVDIQHKYVSKHISKYARHMSGQRKYRTSNLVDLITVLAFMTKLAAVSDQEKISDGNDMWLFQVFLPARHVPIYLLGSSLSGVCRNRHSSREKRKLIDIL